MKVASIGALALGLISYASAGSFGYGLTSPGEYNGGFTSTGETSVVQQLGGTSMESAVVNWGPLGNFNISGIDEIYQSGEVPAGEYGVYLSLNWGGGFTAISASW